MNAIIKPFILGAALLLIFSAAARAECAPDLRAHSPLLNTAVHDLASFGYVRAALAKIRQNNPHTELCTSGVILGKDVYQYGQFYIQVDVRSLDDKRVLSRMRFLFQDASTQAFQNMHRQPWAALNGAQADGVLAALTRDLAFAPLKSAETDPIGLARASTTFARFPQEEGTMMAMAVDSVPGMKKAYLVSWLSRTYGNPFAQVQTTKAVVVGFAETGQALVSENTALYNGLINPFETMREKSWPVGDADYSEALIQSASN